MHYFSKALNVPRFNAVRTPLLLTVFASLFCLLSTVVITAQTTAFTYQGHLTESINSPSGPYDFQFAVFDLAGVQQGPLQTITGVSVANGVFTVTLDFGSTAFAAGEDRYFGDTRKKTACDHLHRP